MVCIPCIVIPFVLWVYHKYIQPWVYPIISTFWTPKPAVKNESDVKDAATTESVKEEVKQEQATAGGDDCDKKND